MLLADVGELGGHLHQVDGRDRVLRARTRRHMCERTAPRVRGSKESATALELSRELDAVKLEDL